MFLAVLKFAFGTDSVIAEISNQGKKELGIQFVSPKKNKGEMNPAASPWPSANVGVCAQTDQHPHYTGALLGRLHCSSCGIN